MGINIGLNLTYLNFAPLHGNSIRSSKQMADTFVDGNLKAELTKWIVRE